MSLDTNAFVDNLKTVLSQFELPEEKVLSESNRLDRLKKRLATEDVEVDDDVAVKGYIFYAHGLNVFKDRIQRGL